MDDEDLVFNILSGKDDEEQTKEQTTISDNQDPQPSPLNSNKDLDQTAQSTSQEINKKPENIADSFIPSYENPLDYINYFEVEKTNTKILKSVSNFLIEKQRRTSKLISVLDIEPKLEINKTIFTRQITTIFPKDDDLILCDSQGNIIFYSIKEQKITKEMKCPLPPKTSDENKIVNCLDITEEHDFLFTGYQLGTICIFDLKKNTCKYTINQICDWKPCIAIKFSYRENDNMFHILSSDINGSVSYSVFKNGAILGWRLVSTSKLIENRQNPIFFLKFLKISENYFGKINETAIFGALDAFYLYTLEPEINEIAVIEKPDYVKDNCAPDLQIGIGKPMINRYNKNTNDETNKLLMALSWGQVVNFYELTIKNGEVLYPILIGNYINEVSILRIGFLANSVLCFIDNKFIFKILNTRKINYGPVEVTRIIKNLVIPKTNKDSVLQNETLLERNVLPQKIIKDQENDDVIQNTYLYTIIENNSELYILCKDALYGGNLVDWEIFLNKLHKKEDYLSLFLIGIDIYQGKMNALLNIPSEEEIRKKKVGDFLRNIISEYVLFTTGSKKSGSFDSPEEIELISRCMNITIELCIEIESFDYLLKNIEPLFETIEYGEFFLVKLEPFILCDKIKNLLLSEEIVDDIIELYVKKDKFEMLSQLLLHLNIKCLDTPKIKKKIESLNLISPLIYIYMSGSEEKYFEPIKIMYDYFSFKAKEMSNFKNYNNALKDNSAKLVLNSKQYFGHKILWYCKICLTGRKFPDTEEKMKPDLFNKLICDMVYWLISEKIMNIFLDFDCKDFFSIIKNIFSMKLYHSKLVETAKDQNLKIPIIAALSNATCYINDIEPLSLIKYIVSFCQKKSDEVKLYLYDFVIYSFKENNLDKNLRIESAYFILSNYEKIIKNINHQELSSLIKAIITLIDDKMFYDNDYNKLLQSINSQIFDEVKLFLVDKMKQYQNCLSLFLDEKSQINNKINRLFGWIHNTFSTLTNSKLKTDFKQCILSCITKIASLNLEKFEAMIREVFPDEKKLIINKISKEDKTILFNYISLLAKLIRSTAEENEKQENIEVPILDEDPDMIIYILTLHIKLLCEYKKFDEILSVLQSCSLYPLEECLNLCLEHKAYDGAIYLYQTSGELSKAVDLVLERIENTTNDLLEDIKNNKNDINNNENILNVYLNELTKFLNDGIRVCEHNETETDDIWFNILNKLFYYETHLNELHKKYTDNKKKSIEKFQEKLLKDIKDLMEKMCSYVSITRIINVVSERNKNVGFKEFRELIMKIFTAYSHQTTILESVRRLFTNLILENENQFQRLNQEGELLDIDKCEKCQKEFNKEFKSKEKILIFNCKHNFHKECCGKERTSHGLEEVCPLCRQTDVEESNNNKMSGFVRKSTTILEEKKKNKKEFQVEVTFHTQKMFQKLTKLDKKLETKNKLMIYNSINEIPGGMENMN